MSDLTVGLRGGMEMVVQRHHLASILGNIGASVLSTAHVVLVLEQAARNAIEGRLPEGMITVGTKVNVRHLAAAPLGATVRAEAYLKEINGRRLLFEVAAYDEVEKISEGENEQLIVSLDRFLKRVIDKQVAVNMKKYRDPHDQG
ncbi:MAG: thioesterase [Deltaproteobacteria bacterium]|nr:thioesterase [Deltaproteobacteria bacterium]